MSSANPSLPIGSLVKSSEADIFSQLATGHVHGKYHNPPLYSDSQVFEALRQAVKDSLGIDNATVRYKGSCSKGTQIHTSDSDIDIETPGRRITREDKLRFVEYLKTLPGEMIHKSLIKVKRLAIECLIGGRPTDLVFAQSAAIAERSSAPGTSLEERFRNNTAGRNAARVLKFALNSTSAYDRPMKFPSFVLELIVLHTQEANKAKNQLYDQLGDGSMQLFCDSLQYVVDRPDFPKQFCDSCNYDAKCSRCQWLTCTTRNEKTQEVGKEKRQSLSTHFKQLLHIFCATRVYSHDGLSLADMERWVRSQAAMPHFTPLGFVPTWIFTHMVSHEQRTQLVCLGDLPLVQHENGPVDVQRLLDAKCKIARSFVSGPFGTYTQHIQHERVQSLCKSINVSSQKQPVSSSTYHNIQSMSCFPKIRYKDSILIVSVAGKDQASDFLNMNDALDALRFGTKVPTSVVLLPGKHLIHSQLKFDCPYSVQVIGNGDLGEITISCDTTHMVSTMCCVQGPMPPSSPSSQVSFENLHFRHLSAFIHNLPTHCVNVSQRAVAEMRSCSFESTGASCVADVESKLIMHECQTLGPGSGVLVHGGYVEASKCIISNSARVSVEVRSGGHAKFDDCTIEDSKDHGVALHQGGREIELLKCIIKRCGKHPCMSGVLVDCGRAVLRRCCIQENRSDGITVQDFDACAHLDIEGSTISNNYGSGIALRGGSATIKRNRIQENSRDGLFVSFESGERVAFRSIQILHNTFNGQQYPVEVMSDTKDRIFDYIEFDGNNDLQSAPALCCANLRLEEWLTNEKELTKELSANAEPFLIRIDSETLAGDSDKRLHAALCRELNSFSKQLLIDCHERQEDVPSDHDFNILGSPSLSNSHKDVDKLASCQITDLIAHIGRRAKGCVLYGTLCTRPIRRMSIRTVLEDSQGNAVNIAVYNMPCIGKDHWRSCFPKGMRVGIREPFLKWRSDLTLVLRIDDPGDLVHDTPVCAWPDCGKAQSNGEGSFNVKLLRCTQCGDVWYCGGKCQKLHWTRGGHKHSCKPSRSSGQ